MAVASDLEGTLTTGATWRGFGRYLKLHRSALAYRWFLLTHLPGVPLVKAGLIDEQNYKNRWLADLLRLYAGATKAEVEHMAEWVVEHEMWPARRQPVLDELERYRREGQRVIVASGTYQPIAEAFARRIGAEALGTALEFADGRLTGRLIGPSRVRQDKADQVLAALNGDRLAAAFGDTDSDVPLLEASECAVAVAPERKLRRIAETRGWRIIEASQ